MRDGGAHGAGRLAVNKPSTQRSSLLVGLGTGCTPSGVRFLPKWSHNKYEQTLWRTAEKKGTFWEQFNDVNTIALNTLKPIPNSKPKKKRVGRGQGSGRGLSCGRGQRSQTKRKTNDIPNGFEGGQTPLYRRVPKFGFTNKMFKLEYSSITLAQLQYWIDTGRILCPEGSTITMKTLIDSKLLPRIKWPGVKLLAKGHEWFRAKIDIEVPRVSPAAVQVIERNGGSIRCVYYNRVAFHAHLHPHKYEVMPKRGMPPPKLWKYYSREDIRGYLANSDPLTDVVPDIEYERWLEKTRQQPQKTTTRH